MWVTVSTQNYFSFRNWYFWGVENPSDRGGRVVASDAITLQKLSMIELAVIEFKTGLSTSLQVDSSFLTWEPKTGILTSKLVLKMTLMQLFCLYRDKTILGCTFEGSKDFQSLFLGEHLSTAIIPQTKILPCLYSYLCKELQVS